MAVEHSQLLNSIITIKQSNKTDAQGLYPMESEATEVMSKHVWEDYDPARVRTSENRLCTLYSPVYKMSDDIFKKNIYTYV